MTTHAQALFGTYAGNIQVAIMSLTAIPRDEMLSELKEAHSRISQAEAWGPMVDPSKWTSGKRFDNAQETRAFIDATVKFIEAIPDAAYDQSAGAAS